MPQAPVAALISLAEYIRLLKSYETLNCYPLSPRNSGSPILVEVFSDAGRLSDHGQLYYFDGLLIGSLKLS